MNRFVIWIVAALLLAGTMNSREANAQSCAKEVGHLVSLDGLVEIQHTGANSWHRLRLNAAMCQGDTVRVGARSRAAIALVNDAVLRLDQNTTMRLTEIVREPAKKSLLSLIKGVFQSFSRKPRKLEVNTAYLNGTIEGTEFLFEVLENRASLLVLEGEVVASNRRGRVILAGGQAAEASRNTAPVKRIVARPRDAVQWGLYYPSVLAGANNAGSATGRAATLLNAGRVTEAETEIARAIAGNSDPALAYALRAIIDVVQNRGADAYANAQKSVQLAPRSAAAKIALSYAYQARFNLPAALNAMLDAVKVEPSNALAWARLAELHLSLGQRGESSDAAVRAVELAPDLARTRSVLGFSALAELDINTAAKSFRDAIKLGPADPLPRLGLGLAKIKQGDLEAGRREIDIAVGLDSSNALLRSYLGKAYFEEKRSPLDAQQLAIAKELDPRDPTPWLYDAIRKQTENRPGEALVDLQGSIDRNDNRAVYRGRLQLDQDRAARGTSLGRIFTDLGFINPGVQEATKSLTLDPANASAHRFLSDLYRGRRRHESARVSELLQAQMMQDINVNPVQPSLSEANLNLVARGGPSEAGFNEFTPLFERNGVQLNAAGVYGNNGTKGEEIVLSGVYNKFSLSAGQFHTQTDGFRANNLVKQDIYNLFAQAAITERLNAQVEYRRRETLEGDLETRFNPDVFSEDRRRDLKQDMGRIGIRYSPTPNLDLLLSYVRADKEQALGFTVDPFVIPAFTIGPFGPFGPFTQTSANFGTVEDASDQLEGQALYRRGAVNLITGAAYNMVDKKFRTTVTSTVTLPIPPLGNLVTAGDVLTNVFRNSDLEHTRGYAYANINYPDPVTWTMGVSVDDFADKGVGVTEQNLEVKAVDWKFGVQWKFANRLRLRMAAFEATKASLATNQTLEPTQVAGFNQFFDEVEGTKSERYGIGLDWQPMDKMFVGVEASYRDVEVPVPFFPSAGGSFFEFEDRDERVLRAYVHLNPIDEVAINAEIKYDIYNSQRGRNSNLPKELDTLSIPIEARYFHPSGFFASLGGTYVHQDLRRRPDATAADGEDSFFLIDSSIGFRLPKRRGSISLQARNLLNHGFSYQDDSFREFGDDPSIGPYIPDRAIIGRVNLNF